MVDIQTVSIVLASASVIAGVIYYAFQIRHQNRMRKTDLVIRLYSRIQSDDYSDAMRVVMNLEFKDYDEFVKKYGPMFHRTQAFQEVAKSLTRVWGFYDLVGTLLYRRHIDLGLVYDILGVSEIKRIYDKTKPLIVEFGKELNEPVWMRGFIYLYNELLRKEPQLRKTWEKVSLPTISETNSL
jgi:hypothetical protein